MQTRDVETTHPAQEYVIRAIRALFRSSVIVVIVLWVFALREGYAGADWLVFGVGLTAVLAGSLAGGLVDARPRVLGLAVSALGPSMALLFMLTHAIPMRAQLAGAQAAARLESASPLIVSGAVLLGFAGAALGSALRARFDSLGRSATD